jgi:hypothetical protein
MSYEEYSRERPDNKVSREQFERMKQSVVVNIDVKPVNLTWRQHLEGITK